MKAVRNLAACLLVFTGGVVGTAGIAVAQTLPTPTLTKATATSLTIAWSGGGVYNVQWATSPTAGYTTMGVTCCTTTISGLTSSTAYSVRLAGNTEVYSPAVTFTTAAAAPTVTVAPPKVTVQKPDSLVFTWTSPVTDANRFILRYRQSGTTTFTEYVGTNTGGTLTGLKAATDYDVELVVQKVGTYAYSSGVSKVRTAAPYAPPVISLGAGSYDAQGLWIVPVSWTTYPDTAAYSIVAYSDAAATTTTQVSFWNPDTKRLSASDAISAPSGSTITQVYLKVQAYSAASIKLAESAPLAVSLVAPPWTKLGGATSFTNITAGSATNMAATNAGALLAWNGSSFAPMNPAVAMAQTSVAADGTWWGLKADGTIWRFASSTWTQVAGALKQISVGSATNIWGVTASNAIVKWNGSSWTTMPGSFKNVSAAADGTVWAVRASDGAVHNWTGTAWQLYSGTATQIAAGSASNVWMIDTKGVLYKRVSNAWNPWPVAGTSKAVAAGADGTVVVIRSDNQAYRKP